MVRYYASIKKEVEVDIQIGKKLVAFGLAILSQPDYLLLDEQYLHGRSGKLLISKKRLREIYHQHEFSILYATNDIHAALQVATKIVVLNKGVIQQAGSPIDIYNKPANYYMAGLTGTPMMNFLDIRLCDENGEITLAGDSFTIKLPEISRSTLLEHLQKRLILGIRPEDIHHPDNQPEGINGLVMNVKVEASKVYRNNTIHFLTAGDHHFIARMGPFDTFPVGKKVSVFLDESKLHLFDPSRDPENPSRLEWIEVSG